MMVDHRTQISTQDFPKRVFMDPTMNRDGARVEYRRLDADNNPRFDELDITRLTCHPDDSITGYRSVVSYVVLASSRQHCEDKFQNFKRELREPVKYV